MSGQITFKLKFGIRLFIGLCLFMMMGNSFAEETAYRTVTDIDYTGNGEITDLLDLYIPLNTEAFTTIIYVVGGMDNNDGKAYATDIGQHFATAGFAVVIPNRSSNVIADLETNANETAAAIGWTINHIERYGGSRSRILVMSQSAGVRPLALAVMNPVYLETYNLDMSGIFGMIFMDGLLETEAKHVVLNLIPDRQPETVAYFSPVSYITDAIPPILFIHGEDEIERIMEFNGEFADLVNESGGRTTWVRVPGSHGQARSQIGTESDQTSAVIFEWIDTLFIEN